MASRKRGASTEAGRTHCSGPKFDTAGEVTTQTIAAVIRNLQEKFGPGYYVVPEPITEGGIQIQSWPGKPADASYTMIQTARFAEIQPGAGRWPHIGPTTLSAWQTEPTTLIWRQTNGHFYLKALNGAPVWTPEEVKKLADAFSSQGWKCTNVKMSAKRLRGAPSSK